MNIHEKIPGLEFDHNDISSIIEEVTGLRRQIKEVDGSDSKEYVLKKRLTDRLNRLDNLLLNFVDIDRETRDREVTGGLAISPTIATRCLTDFERTAVYWCAIRDSVNELKKRFPGEKLKIIEAGSGPYGLLTLAAATMLSPEEAEFGLIDIFSENLDNSRRLIQKLGFQHNFYYFNEDAAQIDFGRTPLLKPHLIMADVMFRALATEPQVAVTIAMANKMHPHGIFLPQQIDLDLILKRLSLDPKQDRNNHGIKIGTILQFVAANAQAILDDIGNIEKPGKISRTFELPPTVRTTLFDPSTAIKKARSTVYALVSTKVTLFSDWTLEREASDITKDAYFEHVPGGIESESITIACPIAGSCDCFGPIGLEVKI